MISRPLSRVSKRGLHSLLVSPKVLPFASVLRHRFTMASADFSPFVVTHGLHTLFPSANEISLDCRE